MILVKLFQTSDMPDDVFRFLLGAGVVTKDGTGEYIIGYFENDMREISIEDELALIRRVDAWFVSEGATARERVLVHHGKFAFDNDFLFKTQEGQ